MSSRRNSRVWAAQILFGYDFNRVEPNQAIASFWAGRHVDDKARSYTEELVQGVIADLPAIDERLQAYAENWKLSRMTGVDRNILRLCLYEMTHVRDVPPIVALDEAVDIAKEFGGEESGRFVNGILDRALQDLDRPARTADSSGDPAR